MNVFLILLLTFLIYSAMTDFKMIRAIKLYIGDLINKDWQRFDGYGFWLFCGLGGSGKTLSMVEYMDRMRLRYPDVKIYCNFAYAGSHGLIEGWQDILQCENYSMKAVTADEFKKLNTYNRYQRGDRFYEKVHHGIIFGFDEIHLTFASQKWETAPDNMLEYISQQRKLHKQIVASAQVFTRVDKKLREQTNYVVECSSWFGSRWVFNKYFHTSDFLANDEKLDAGARKRNVKKRYNFVATNAIRNLYDTYQVMINLNEPKSTAHIELDRMRKLIADNLG